MLYLLKRKTRYYYARRVPEEVQELDDRRIIRISLKTDSKTIAARKAAILNGEVESYWQSLVQNNTSHDSTLFGKIVRLVRKNGFSYMPLNIVATLPIEELVGRLRAIPDANKLHTEAMLGGKEEPKFLLSLALEKYWGYTKNRIINKSEDQKRKWRNPRRKAIENFILAIGDKEIKSIDRADILKFQDWWIGRIEKEGKTANAANKNLIHLKDLIGVVSDNMELGIDVQTLFKRIMLSTRFQKKRAPFTKEQTDKLLSDKKLTLMNEDARWFLFAAAGTGARPSEIVGLLPEDIRLDVPIPHISITDRIERPLKTPHSQREIPLVGYALEAFKNMPEGFPRYRDKPDNLTNAVNMFLRRNGLYPTPEHSVYSFRHGFQDLILAVNTPDRVQAELMGHKFRRPKYGDGASLEQKLYWIKASLVISPKCLEQQPGFMCM